MKGLIAFIAVYISIYGGAHVYAFIKLKRGMAFNPWTGAGIAIFMGLMILAPIFMRIGERTGHDDLAAGLAYVGFAWMGVLFLFVSSAFCFDIYRGLLAVARFMTGKYLVAITPTHGFACMVSMVVAFLLTKLVYKLNPGFTELGKGSAAYVSRGTGTWGPPVRFLAPPEVTLIQITSNQS